MVALAPRARSPHEHRRRNLFLLGRHARWPPHSWLGVQLRSSRPNQAAQVQLKVRKAPIGEHAESKHCAS